MCKHIQTRVLLYSYYRRVSHPRKSNHFHPSPKMRPGLTYHPCVTSYHSCQRAPQLHSLSPPTDVAPGCALTIEARTRERYPPADRDAQKCIKSVHRQRERPTHSCVSLHDALAQGAVYKRATRSYCSLEGNARARRLTPRTEPTSGASRCAPGYC